MVLLMLFALLAGAATALSPCVLPVLPAVLGAGVTGGRRRPLGVVTGLVLAFTFATIALVYVIDALGLPDDLVRTLAIITLFGFGITLLIPGLGDRIEAFGSRIAPGPARVGGDGFGSGLLLGASLGLVYTPCAGPILAGVITVSAAQDFTAGKLAVALAYAVGSGAVLYLLMLGGRKLVDRIKPARAWVQAGTGAVMVLVAIAMTADLDLKFQNAIADDLPSVLVNPSGELEKSSAVSDELQKVRGGEATQEGGAAEAAAGVTLPDYGPAPDFTDTQQWFNTPGGQPLSIADLTQKQGRVVLIDFWTYTCINCIRTLPYVKSWDEKYRDHGLTVVGVHSPEFAFEKDAGNVENAIADEGIAYPVVQDNELGTWNAFANQYWPAKYLIDAAGEVRYVHFGEGGYDETEKAIRSLLAEAGDRGLGADAKPDGQIETADRDLRTPETYLGLARAQGWINGPQSGEKDYGSPDPASLDLNQFAYGGAWDIADESATAVRDASLALSFQARRVFLVLGSPGGVPRDVQVLLDGKPIADADAGDDVHGAMATITGQRLYRLVDLPEAGRHTLELRFADGIEGYAFTFG
jgi:cytochrome c biogenesis protein CcdA/thiol-disulfide isomerase/thioredoxin